MSSEEMTVLRCVVCTNEIPEKRIRRGACTCTSECKKQLRHIRASLREKTICRKCGHRLRRKVEPQGGELGSQLPLGVIQSSENNHQEGKQP